LVAVCCGSANAAEVGVGAGVDVDACDEGVGSGEGCMLCGLAGNWGCGCIAGRVRGREGGREGGRSRAVERCGRYAAISWRGGGSGDGLEVAS
jgi:hypothetical protein